MITGGVAAIGAGILVLNVKSNVQATVGAGAALFAGSDPGDTIEVEATATESSSGLALGGGIGLVAINGQVVVLNTDATQKAEVLDGAKLGRAGGGIVVTANATRTTWTLSVSGAVAGVAAGASISLLDVGGDTIASVGNVAIATDAADPAQGAVSGAAITAIATVSPEAKAYGIQAGVGAGISGVVALSTLAGTTRAAYGGHGPLGR